MTSNSFYVQEPKLNLLSDAVVDVVLNRHRGILNSTLPHAELDMLIAARLAHVSGRMTDLCRSLAHHAAELEKQSDPLRVDRILSQFKLTSDARLLDVGCGAGQTLFDLQKASGCKCFGVDVDKAAIEFGQRVVALRQIQNVSLLKSSGDSLPFLDGTFTHVLCRVALNYMHPPSALSEIARVLAPSGVLWLQVENMGMDLKLLRSASSIREFVSKGVDFSIGCFCAISRIQLRPGALGRFPGRVFISNGNLVRELRRNKCYVTEQEGLMRFFGILCATLVHATKK